MEYIIQTFSEGHLFSTSIGVKRRFDTRKLQKIYLLATSKYTETLRARGRSGELARAGGPRQGPRFSEFPTGMDSADGQRRTRRVSGPRVDFFFPFGLPLTFCTITHCSGNSRCVPGYGSGHLRGTDALSGTFAVCLRAPVTSACLLAALLHWLFRV